MRITLKRKSGAVSKFYRFDATLTVEVNMRTTFITFSVVLTQNFLLKSPTTTKASVILCAAYVITSIEMVFISKGNDCGNHNDDKQSMEYMAWRSLPCGVFLTKLAELVVV